MEKQGQPFVAVISLDDFAVLERLKGEDRAAEFSRRAARAALEAGGPEPTDDEIVEAVKQTREALYRERYGTAAP